MEENKGIRKDERGESGRGRGEEERRGEERGREEGEGVTEKTYNCTTLECHSPKPRCQSCVRS